MKRPKLTVEKRSVFGKKVKKLRREGILPANIYGKDIKSLAVQLKDKEFETVFKEAGETGLVDIAVNGEVKPVLIHNVQIEPLSNQYLHADFYQVNLKEKIKAMVPVVAVGEAKAVIDKVGIVLQPLSEIEVEALPEDLPEKIEVNVEKLAALDEQITVSGLKAPEEVEILTDPAQVVVKIAALVSKEAEELAAQEAAAAEAAKAEAAPAEGVTPAEGAAPPAEGEVKPETKAAPSEKPAATETPKEEKPQ
ncbi:MAG: 50S ribosomal protein L25 [Candidatus Levybacteria bacterium]|nr:50S ribosomal protein L25 [Candidatus Levybacteria bacterium]